MPEAGYLPIPKKLAQAGVKDMVRISDARMSGTAFGTVVLHVTPDAASGGTLALVRSGDRIRLSVKQRRLELGVGDDELARRRSSLVAPIEPRRGYARLYAEHVTQADLGCDFDFLRA
jgi:dihydroxy-acid dehydratase